MIVRDDDIFRFIGGYTTPVDVLNRVKQVHKIIVDGGAIHVAAIICGTLKDFPGGLEFLKRAHNKQELVPEVHGWNHIDYAELGESEIIEHLNRCIDVIYSNFNYVPTKFYTPWGASSSIIKDAANQVGLEMIDCSKVLYPKRKFFGGKMWKEYSKIVRNNKRELLIHWHEDKWFNTESHSLVKTLRTIREDKNYFS